MKLLTIFPLAICLLAIWVGFPSVAGRDFQTGKQSPEKPGECPVDHCICLPPIVYKCRRDNECKGRKKCCHECCVKDCVDPV